MPVFQQKKQTDLLSRYKSPDESLSNRQLKLAGFYVRHKIVMQQILMGLFVAVVVGLSIFSIFGWGNYLAFGYTLDRTIIVQNVLRMQRAIPVERFFGGTQLQLGTTLVFTGAEGKYDFVADATNRSARHVATVSYYFAFSGGQTEHMQLTLLPETTQSLAILGFTHERFPSGASLVIDNVSWKRVSPHDVRDVGQYMQERLNFVVENFSYTRKSVSAGVPAHEVSFDITNTTAYSYWQPGLYITFLNNGIPTGVRFIVLDGFLSGQTTRVQLNTLEDDFAATDIRVTPLINVFDPSVFMEPEV